jgi:hypothetical protein
MVNPRCILCEVLTEPTVVYYDDACMIRGWRCPHCGSSLINPSDISKAMNLLKETAKV